MLSDADHSIYAKVFLFFSILKSIFMCRALSGDYLWAPVNGLCEEPAGCPRSVVRRSVRVGCERLALRLNLSHRVVSHLRALLEAALRKEKTLIVAIDTV